MALTDVTFLSCTTPVGLAKFDWNIPITSKDFVLKHLFTKHCYNTIKDQTVC